MNYLLSVIVPAHNEERTICKTVDVQFNQILCNVLLFIPLGILLKLLGLNTLLILLIGFAFSCSIVLLQYLLKLGLCEFDDVFHNTLGTLIGLFIGNWISKNRGD